MSLCILVAFEIGQCLELINTTQRCCNENQFGAFAPRTETPPSRKSVLNLKPCWLLSVLETNGKRTR